MGLDQYKDITPTVTREFALPQTHRFRGKARYEDENGNTFFESWVVPAFGPTSEDSYYIVPRGLEGNLPAISYDIYGSSKYAWILLVFNDLTDPFEEVVAGMSLRYPLPTKLFEQTVLKLLT